MPKGFIHITDTEALTDLCDRLKKADYITVDTEFLRDNSYWPKLCLVQVAGPDVAAIIDPIAPLIDLQPLLDLMVDPNVLKVFHAARQDIEIFLRLSGRIPEPLFDTQVAAMVCGYGDSVSYETLVAKIARAALDKSSRFTDWTRRPLTERQLQYAIGDVTHLRKVYETLWSELDRNKRTEWLNDEMAILMDPATYIVEPDQAWQRIKTRTTNRRFLGVLREVAAWRELEARARDLPRGRMLKDDALLELAAHPPSSLDDMKQSRGVPKGFADGKLGPSLLDAVLRGLNCPESDLPEPEKTVEPPRGVGPLVELLKVMLKLQCEDHGVAQKLVANTSDLEQIAGDDEADVAALKGWRREVFGDAALALKHGKLALAAEGRRIRLIRLDKGA